ncbi:hypothetical protein KIPB_012372, partial [Kipferlia bialata]|eukprot:g12372.t1
MSLLLQIDDVAKIISSKDPSKALAKYLTESKWTGRVSQRRITETVLRTLLLRSPESKRDMVAQMCERFIKDVSEKHSSLASGYRTVVTETLALKSLVLAPHSDRFFRPSDKAVELVVDTVGIKK